MDDMDDVNHREESYKFLQSCFDRKTTVDDLLVANIALSPQGLEEYTTCYWAILGLQQLNFLRVNLGLGPIEARCLCEKLLGTKKMQAILFNYLGSWTAIDGVSEEFLQRLSESVRVQLKSCFVAREDLIVLFHFVMHNLTRRAWCKVGDRFDWPEDSAAGLVINDRWPSVVTGGHVDDQLFEFVLPAVSWVTGSHQVQVDVSSMVKVNYLTFAAYYGARDCFARRWSVASCGERGAQDYGYWAIVGGDVEIFKIAVQQPIAFQRCCCLAIILGRQQMLEYLIGHSPYNLREGPLEWYVTAFNSNNQHFLDSVWPKLASERRLIITKAVIRNWYHTLRTLQSGWQMDASDIAGHARLLDGYLKSEWLADLATDFSDYAEEWTFWHMLAVLNVGDWTEQLQFVAPWLQDSINIQDGLGRSALHLAVQMKHIQVTMRLLQVPGIELDLLDARRYSARQLIVNNGWQMLLSSNDERDEMYSNDTESGHRADGSERDGAMVEYLTDRKRVRRQSMKMKREM